MTSCAPCARPRLRCHESWKLHSHFWQRSPAHDSDRRIDDIVRLAREYHVDGVIDANLKFCTLYDTEKSAVAKALEAEGVPCLGLETDYTDNDAEQLRTRIEAFVEMLG